MARAGWFLWGKFRRRSRTRPPHRTHNCMCSQCPFVCNRELECWHNGQADRQRTDKRQCRKLLGDGFHGETSFRIFTKSVGPAHGNCKRFRTKPRFRSTKWRKGNKNAKSRGLLAENISCRGRRPRRPAGNAHFPDDCRAASPLAAAATLLPGNTGTSAPHPALRGHLPPRGKAGKFYPSKFVMLFKLTPRVEALCSRAEVAGGRMPMAPSTIRVLLKLMIKR